MPSCSVAAPAPSALRTTMPVSPKPSPPSMIRRSDGASSPASLVSSFSCRRRRSSGRGCAANPAAGRAVGEIDGAGVPDAAGEIVVQRRDERDRAPVPRENGAGRVDVEHASAGAGVAHRQGAVEGQFRAVGEIEGLPPQEAADVRAGGGLPEELVVAEAALDLQAGRQIVRCQVSEEGDVVVVAHVDAEALDVASLPEEVVLAGAGGDTAVDQAAVNPCVVGAVALLDVLIEQAAEHLEPVPRRRPVKPGR